MVGLFTLRNRLCVLQNLAAINCNLISFVIHIPGIPSSPVGPATPLGPLSPDGPGNPDGPVLPKGPVGPRPPNVENKSVFTLHNIYLCYNTVGYSQQIRLTASN